MKVIIDLIKEQLNNATLIWKLALYNMKSEYSNHYLGAFWNILQPLLQVLIYYVVFGMGLRGNAHVGDINYLLHLITGLFPWIFISQAINGGSNAIHAQLGLVTKMKFPSSVLLSISYMNNFLNLLFTTVIILILSFANHFVSFYHYFEFIYFIIASYTLIMAINLIMSTLVILIRDTKQMLQNILRMCFFVTPIFWDANNVGPILKVITLVNPFAYLIGIYRNAFIVGKGMFYGNISDHLYFWTVTILLFFIGTHIHNRFKNRLVDYL
ncbi:ABC transporter permease [Macrococcus capreoli]